MQNRKKFLAPVVQTLLALNDGFFRTVVVHCQSGKTRSAAAHEIAKAGR